MATFSKAFPPMTDDNKSPLDTVFSKLKNLVFILNGYYCTKATARTGEASRPVMLSGKAMK